MKRAGSQNSRRKTAKTTTRSPRAHAYRLINDVGRFGSYAPGYYADLWIEDVSMANLSIFGDEALELPKPVIFSGNLSILETVDFPVANNSWLVMSQRMLAALKSVGKFRHRAFPVVVTDSRVARDRWYDTTGEFQETMVNRDYRVVQLLERLDIFDFERSKYTRNPRFPGSVGHVDEYVFKPLRGGLPPIFHVKGEPVKVFVSHPARVALEKARVTGVEYVSLNGMKGGKGMVVDVPTRRLKEV